MLFLLPHAALLASASLTRAQATRKGEAIPLRAHCTCCWGAQKGATGASGLGEAEAQPCLGLWDCLPAVCLCVRSGLGLSQLEQAGPQLAQSYRFT